MLHARLRQRCVYAVRVLSLRIPHLGGRHRIAAAASAAGDQDPSVGQERRRVISARDQARVVEHLRRARGDVDQLRRRDDGAGNADAPDDENGAVGQNRRRMARPRRSQRRQGRLRAGPDVVNGDSGRRAGARLAADQQPPVARQPCGRLTGEERTRPGRRFGVGNRRDEERHQRRRKESP